MKRHFKGGVTAKAIAEAPGLTFSQKDRLQHKWLRKTFGQAITYPTHWLPSTQSFIDASLLGMGWGMNPAPLVKEHLATRRLLELIPGAYLDVPLYWQVNRLAAEQLSGLTKKIVAAARF
jgi:LysR family transcriptional regulator (chromosome initiation inhibitor)